MLKECLDSLPDELEEYYETIIDRIEETFRWDAYVVLEILSRAEETIRVNSVLEALAISKATTSRDAKRRLKKLDLADKLLEAKSRLMALSGSLIEFRVIRTQQPAGAVSVDDSDVDSSDEGDGDYSPEYEAVQLMHQTVKDFVRARDFKSIVFRSRSAHVASNGHTFLARMYLFSSQSVLQSRTLAHQFARQARAAEQTTKESQIQLFQHCGSIYTMANLLSPGVTIGNTEAGLTMAVSSGLILYLEDARQENPSVFKDSHIDFLHLLVLALESDVAGGLPCQSANLIADFLMKNGYTPKISGRGFQRCLRVVNSHIKYNNKSVTTDACIHLLLRVLELQASLGCNIWTETRVYDLPPEAEMYVHNWVESQPEIRQKIQEEHEQLEREAEKINPTELEEANRPSVLN